ncbi:ORF066 [Saltwater crocodilepox virus]|nr:ORF068 [Saltwater crocodilepox virus]QGT47586.1 ORF066 [Saltwater crocodilepox virus]
MRRDRERLLAAAAVAADHQPLQVVRRGVGAQPVHVLLQQARRHVRAAHERVADRLDAADEERGHLLDGGEVRPRHPVRDEPQVGDHLAAAHGARQLRRADAGRDGRLRDQQQIAAHEHLRRRAREPREVDDRREQVRDVPAVADGAARVQPPLAARAYRQQDGHPVHLVTNDEVAVRFAQPVLDLPLFAEPLEQRQLARQGAAARPVEARGEHAAVVGRHEQHQPVRLLARRGDARLAGGAGLAHAQQIFGPPENAPELVRGHAQQARARGFGGGAVLAVARVRGRGGRLGAAAPLGLGGRLPGLARGRSPATPLPRRRPHLARAPYRSCRRTRTTVSISRHINGSRGQKRTFYHRGRRETSARLEIRLPRRRPRNGRSAGVARRARPRSAALALRAVPRARGPGARAARLPAAPAARASARTHAAAQVHGQRLPALGLRGRAEHRRQHGQKSMKTSWSMLRITWSPSFLSRGTRVNSRASGTTRLLSRHASWGLHGTPVITKYMRKCAASALHVTGCGAPSGVSSSVFEK